ncbi:MAG: arsenite methyltransferase [Candidatus Brocadiia bacterium]
MKKSDIKKIVKAGYGKIAKSESSCCGSGCGCGGGGVGLSQSISRGIGYSDAEIKAVPDGANLGLGCGNPLALASLKPGETVLDLGSGAGFDCFLASKKVGPRGRVIGVDMTPEMIAKARANARKGNYANVEFRAGEIEKLPVDDGSIDIIISNCVINLSPDKPAVFKEAFRVLKPGGRLMVSDIVMVKPMPAAIKKSIGAYVGCLTGALMKADYIRAVKDAGFGKVEVLDEAAYPIKYLANDPTAQALAQTVNASSKAVQEAARSVASIKVRAIKG